MICFYQFVKLNISCAVCLLGEFNLDLGGSKCKCAILVSFFFQFFCYRIEISDRFCNIALVIRVFELLSLHVCKSPSGTDDSLRIFRTDNIGISVYLPYNRKRKTINIRAQRAQVLCQQFWQHVCSPVHQIYSRASVSGLHVKCRVRSNIIADVGNVNTNLKIAIL